VNTSPDAGSRPDLAGREHLHRHGRLCVSATEKQHSAGDLVRDALYFFIHVRDDYQSYG